MDDPMEPAPPHDDPDAEVSETPSTADMTAERQLQCDLFWLAYHGDHNIEKLAEQGVDLTTKICIDVSLDEYCDCGPVFESMSQLVSLEQLEVFLKEILDHGCCACAENAVPDMRQRAGLEPIHVAAVRGHTWLVKFLLEHGACANAPTVILKATPLHLATHAKLDPTQELIHCLLAVGAEVNARNVGQATPLISAAGAGNYKAIETLVEAKCDLNAQNEDGQTALHLAVSYGEEECVDRLVKAGANVNLHCNRGWFPLLVAVRHAKMEIVKMLLLGACDLNQATQASRRDTALHNAVYQGSVELTRMFLEAGANPDVKGDAGHTPLMAAAYSDMCYIVQLLIEHHCDVNIRNNHGYTALHLAAWDGHIAIVQMLVEAGGHHDMRTDDKNTPLALACHGNHLKVVRYLLEHGCEVNNQDKDMDTPMHYVTYNGCLESTRLLLHHGANPDVCNSVKATPLWNAVYMRRPAIITELLQHNVRLDISSQGIDQHSHTDAVVLVYLDAKTPLYVACDRGTFDTAKLLVLAGTDLSKEDWYWSDSYPKSLQKNDEMMAWLANKATNPPCLRRLCRAYLRRYFGLDLRKKVPEMEIPGTLKDFLMLKYL